VSSAEYYGFDAKLKAAGAEQSATAAGRSGKGAEQSASGTRQPSVERGAIRERGRA